MSGEIRGTGLKRMHADKKNILLVNITRLGDMLQATPTIAGMKLENPDAKITVLVEKQFEEVCHSLPGIDEVVGIDLGMTCRALAREQDGIIDAYEYVTELVDKLKARDFDYSLNMSSSAYTALLLKLLEVPKFGGWVADDEGYRIIASDWARLFAASVFHQNRQFNSLNLVDVFRCSADVDLHPRKLQFTLRADALSYADDLLSTAGFTNSGPIIAVQAGASQDKRQWSRARLVELVRRLVHDHGARVVMVGTKKELGLIEPVKAAVDSPNVLIAAGNTSIPQLAALLSKCSCLVTGDTGTMHVSVSVGTPVVSLFLASAFGFETGPYGEGHLVLQPVIGCGPCNPNKPCIGLECHDTIPSSALADLAIARSREDFRVLPENLKSLFDPRHIILYRSTFDEYGFCDLQPITSPEFDTMKKYRDAYRRVWLRHLGGFSVPEASAKFLKPRALAQATDFQSGIASAVEAADQGIALISQLKALITDRSAPGKLLGDVSTKLVQLDRSIEELGFHIPALGPVTRMMIFAKENLSGSDPLLLASQMGSAYQELKARSLTLGSFLQ